MPPTPQELTYLLHPLVPEAIAHNSRTLTSIRSLTSLLLGVSAGLLGLESLAGFAYYVICTCVISLFIHFLLANGRPEEYFVGSGVSETSGGKERADKHERKGAWREIWLGGGVLGENLSGFVLGWAGVGGLVR
ncbi:MAG: hypothetical protein Q9160_008440 [Pyrenula sp. 1 TL-2023]